MRIILDTNVVLSALLWRGRPHHLLTIIGTRNDVRLFSSPALLEELAEVLGRPFASQRLALVGRSATEVLADYLAAIELVEPLQVPRVVAGDLDDDQVIAAAVAAQATLIVTGDRKHLLSLRSHQGIDIVDAAVAITRIEAGR
jgi:putative PIN family toxin of toxin-antitoxin system